MKNNLKRIINTEPALADALDGDYDVYYGTDDNGNEKLFFEVGDKRECLTESLRLTKRALVI